MNDIIRFWKTLCLNYENKRNQPNENPQKKLKQKIKNLKLKFSRKLTCYASICYIVSLDSPIGTEDILTMSQMAPLERMRTVISRNAEMKDIFDKLEEEYRWFLELTNVSEEELFESFKSKKLRTEAFQRADRFGEYVFTVTKEIAERNNYLRILLV